MPVTNPGKPIPADSMFGGGAGILTPFVPSRKAPNAAENGMAAPSRTHPVPGNLAPVCEPTSGIDGSQDIELSIDEVRVALQHLDPFSEDHRDALEHLHERCRYTADEAQTETEASGVHSQWREVERELFGSPGRFLKVDTEHGIGFGASLMDDLDVCPFKLAGIEWTPELDQAVWNRHNWRDLIDNCPSAEYFELETVDEVPGMSDRYFWIAVRDAEEFARQLREFIVGCAADA